MEKVIHRGGCHCGAVRFEVRAPARITVQHCNCSVCSKTGFLHLIVPAEDFTLLSGSAAAADLHLQYRCGQAPVLRGLRHQVVLRAALPSRWLLGQSALSRCGHGGECDGGGLQWSRLGTARCRAGACGALMNCCRRWPCCLRHRPGPPGGRSRQVRAAVAGKTARRRQLYPGCA